MNNFWAIFKREIRVYFASPIAYAVMIIFLVLAGYFFYSSMTYYVLASFQAARNPNLQGLNVIDMVLSPLFGNLSIILLLMLPVLTMRMFSEEKKSGAHELLFSYPVRDMEVLLGKYAASLCVVLLMIGLTALYQLFLWGYGLWEPGVALSGYLGLVLLAAAFVSLGIFISSLTENQVVAAVVSFGVLLMFWVVGWSAAQAGGPLKDVLVYVSLVKHLSNFAKGIVDTADVFYYLCFIFLFLFLTLRSLESKRWRG
ncbi:MAG: ABC transporter permease subunit [Pseudomonadota bacterium]